MGGSSLFSSASKSGRNSSSDCHVCQICYKQFSRRDLRERHRRRCEKSIGKVIPTKKRSCERCISFKVKCDYDKPSCSRCLSRSVACEYKIEPRIKVPLNPAFNINHNSSLVGSLGTFPVQAVDYEAANIAPTALPTPEMVLDVSPPGDISMADLCGDLHAPDAAQEHFRHWNMSEGSNSSNSPWDATTTWSDSSSGINDPLVLDEINFDDHSWPSLSMMSPTLCMDPSVLGMYGSQDFTEQPLTYMASTRQAMENCSWSSF